MCLEVGHFGPAARFGDGFDLLGIEEVVVQAGNLDGGPRLVDRRLPERQQVTDRGAGEGEQDQYALAAPQDMPEFDGLAGWLRFRFGADHFSRGARTSACRVETRLNTVHLRILIRSAIFR